jgi:flagellar hook protein FlgE
MISAINSAINGMNTMQSQIDSSAGGIASYGATAPIPSNPASTTGGTPNPSAIVTLSGSQQDSSTEGLTKNIIGMQQATLIYKANAKTIKAEDQMLGSLLQAKA